MERRAFVLVEGRVLHGWTFSWLRAPRRHAVQGAPVPALRTAVCAVLKGLHGGLLESIDLVHRQRRFTPCSSSGCCGRFHPLTGAARTFAHRREFGPDHTHHIPVEERRCCGVNAPGAGSGGSRAADASVRHQPGEGRSMGWPRSPIACHMPAQRLLDVVSRRFRSRRRKWPSTMVPARRRRWPQHGGAVGGDCLRDAELGARRQRRVVQWHPRDASS